MLGKLIRNKQMSAENREIKEGTSTAALPSSENLRKLNSCRKPHNFSVPKRGISGFALSWCCSICNGEVSDESRTWYIQGLTHGRREHDATYPDLPVGEPRDTDTHSRVGSTQTSGPATPVDLL